MTELKDWLKERLPEGDYTECLRLFGGQRHYLARRDLKERNLSMMRYYDNEVDAGKAPAQVIRELSREFRLSQVRVEDIVRRYS